ncbi:MAG: MFS transporter [Pseudomonadota bacterium]
MQESSQVSFWDAMKLFHHPKVLMMFFFGFGAGLPFLLIFSTLSWWLNEIGVEKAAIGLFAWAGITYSIKWIWAPIIDRWKLPFALGKRRNWMLVGQVGVLIGLVSLSVINPLDNLFLFAACTVFIAFSSSTQDIAIDAFRIESADEHYQGAMSAVYVFGYRLAMFVAGAGALYLASLLTWTSVYQIMAALMFVGIVTTFFVSEPLHAEDKQSDVTPNQINEKVSPWKGPAASIQLSFLKSVIQAVVMPFAEFAKRYGVWAVVVLVLVSVYRLSDLAMGIMVNPFYSDMGYTKAEIATIVKVYGVAMTVLGSFVGGLIIYRYHILRPMLFGAVAVVITNIVFAGLAIVEKDTKILTFVISVDNFSGGFANTALIAYMSSLVNKTYSATQYAIFTSIMTLPGKIVSGFSGIVVEAIGYFHFFLYTAALGIPAVILTVFIMYNEKSSGPKQDSL